MQISIADYLKTRIEEFNKNPELVLKTKGTEYNKEWNNAVECFRKRINKDMKREGRPEFTFIIIRQKLAGIREINDLRWFYGQCAKYSNTYVKGTKIRNTFSKCFWGALDTKKKI